MTSLQRITFSLIIVAFAGVVLEPVRAHAQLEGTYEVAIKKKEEKVVARWSLADWLAQKQRMSLMDSWLAANSHSSPYEFFLETRGVNYGESDGSPSATVTNHNVFSGGLAAYAGFAGLRGSYDSDNEDRTVWHGSLNLRILGRAIQDTHVNLEYGLRGMTLNSPGGALTTPETFQNQYGGVSMDLYLSKHFGIEGSYQRILPAQASDGRTLEGEDESAGVFIDFSILRVFGQWTNQFLKYDGAGQPNSSEFRSGYGGGLRLYF